MENNIESLLQDILAELGEINNKLDRMTKNGNYGVDDVVVAVNDANTEISQILIAQQK